MYFDILNRLVWGSSRLVKPSRLSLEL